MMTKDESNQFRANLAKEKLVLRVVELGVPPDKAESYISEHVQFHAGTGDVLMIHGDQRFLSQGAQLLAQGIRDVISPKDAAEALGVSTKSDSYDPVAAGKAAAEAQKKATDTSLAFR
jgi:hypothetical protein